MERFGSLAGEMADLGYPRGAPSNRRGIPTLIEMQQTLFAHRGSSSQPPVDTFSVAGFRLDCGFLLARMNGSTTSMLLRAICPLTSLTCAQALAVQP